MITRVWLFSMRFPNVSTIADLQVTDVAVMINNEWGDFNVKWTARQLIELAAQLRSINVAFHLLSWLQPTERYMVSAAASLRGLCENTGARSLQFDVEESWFRHPSIYKQGDSPEVITGRARAAVERYWQFDSWPCLLGATSYGFMHPAVKPVADRCHYVLPQAYGTQANSQFAPGVLQERSFRSWQVTRKQVVMGLACYDLYRPSGATQSQAMQTAIARTEDLTVGEVAYWSYEWLVSRFRNEPTTNVQERHAFVKQASIKARRGLSQKSALPSIPASPVPPSPMPTPGGTTPLRPTLRNGSRGQAVIDLQTRLNRAMIPLAIDGRFGHRTEAAVKAFQQAMGLKMDGIVGPQTWRLLLGL